MARLKEYHFELLEEVLRLHAPEHVALLEKAETSKLTDQERGELCELIAKEFAVSGVNEDHEPTPRGTLLEQLLDEVNRPRLVP